MFPNKKITIELFTSNICSNCTQAKHLITELVSELGEKNFELEFIDVVKNIERSVEAGILTTPTLVINHQLVSSSMPKYKELKTMLNKSLHT